MLKDGSDIGIHLSYKIQESPDGLAQAFLIGEDFIKDDSCAMVLGDNIFYGSGFSNLLVNAREKAIKGLATIFGYYVKDPKRFGVVEFDNKGNVLSLDEKPCVPKSNYAVTGLYFYPKGVSEMAKKVKPSKRGELEITTLNQLYLNDHRLNVEIFGRGYTWLDTGTMDSLFEASNFVRTIQNLQGVGISVIEEIAYKNGWISKDQLLKAIENYGKSEYGNNLRNVIADKRYSDRKV